MDNAATESCATGSSSLSSTPTSSASTHRNFSTIYTDANLSSASHTSPPLFQQNEYGENIFKFPPPSHLSHTVVESSECEREFCKLLNHCIAQGCKHSTLQNTSQQDGVEQCPSNSKPSEIRALSSTPANKTAEDDLQNCATCKKLRDHCLQFIDPLQDRLGLSITAALAAYGAVEQLSRLYEMLDEYCNLHRVMEQPEQQQQLPEQQQQESENQANLLNENIAKELKKDHIKIPEEMKCANTDEPRISIQLNQSETSARREALKQHRKICKSVTADSIPLTSSHKDVNLLQRQNTYSGSKSKVSKWTRVKAAFKWERANVPAACSDHHRAPNSVGLMPINHEVARYLRVPTMVCGGGSSADSVLSSSSGHLLSETATPATMSSASSLDDLDSSFHNTIKRDSLRADGKVEHCCSDDNEQTSAVNNFSPPIAPTTSKSESGRNNLATKCFPTKSNRKSDKLASGFEALPEDGVADIKQAKKSRARLPPSPLDLNLKQDLNELDFYYSSSVLRSPKECTQPLNPVRKISSPGNSSVPSSPSRHSDFFAELDSEDLSDVDFSESSTPSQPLTFKSLQQQHEEINRRYKLLCAKLDKEFEAKRRQWEKNKANPNPNTYRALTFLTPPKSEEHSPNPAITANLSTEMLEEHLTPDFKKKLQKWRVKKENLTYSVPNAIQAHTLSHPQAQIQPQTQNQVQPSIQNQCVSPNKETKFDWNLWKNVGHIKLEGQEQQLPSEEFQKKLEQWEKIKRGFHLINAGTDSLKRATKHKNECCKKTSDEDRGGNGLEKEKRTEKHKLNEKDKVDKFVRLKAIVVEPPTKEIEVKTPVGVMKFEGISRKFTRKLYEWEKAKGIGPESSTFALLHPGYCPLDVGKISKESHTSENSPLGRSLSLDSITPIATLPAVSHQASSLSLNNVDDLKETEVDRNNSDPLLDSEFNKIQEPEAVMVEVEDHIVDTASALITVHTQVEQQLPVYKYEQATCNDYCNSRRIQSFESYTNLAPLLLALQRTDEIILCLKQTSPDVADLAEMQECVTSRDYIRNIYPYYMDNLVKPNVLNAISDVQAELSRLKDLIDKCPLDEACCQEIIDERTLKYNEELRGLQESLDILGQQINECQGVRYAGDMIPEINITAAGLLDALPMPSNITSCERELSTTLEATDELSASGKENEPPDTPKSITKQVQRTFSNSSSVGTAKRRLRLRKMGSRQNSKTESDSSEDETEPQRRMKRRSYRMKQRSLEDDCCRKIEEATQNRTNEDVVYILKVRPGHPIEQSEQCQQQTVSPKADTEKITQTRSNVIPAPTDMDETESPMQEVIQTAVYEKFFVKTKRKVFTTISEPSALDGIVFVAQDVGSSTHSEESIKTQDAELLKDISPCNTFGLPDLEDIEKCGALKLSWHGKRAFSLPCKSLSLLDMQQKSFESERRCCSLELLRSFNKAPKETHVPLALDSILAVNKITVGALKSANQFKAVKRMHIEHIFRKHKNHSQSHSQSRLKADSLASDKIYKLTPWESTHVSLEAATKPLTHSNFPNVPSVPGTPLSERAIRLQKAKEDFLKSADTTRTKLPQKHCEDILNAEPILRPEHFEQLSSVEPQSSSCNVSTVQIERTVSDATSQQELHACDTLQRSVSRSSKLSSTFGFAKLASKFRCIKSKKDKDDEETKRGNFLALRSRTGLLSDVSRLVNHERRVDALAKSQSSPQAAAGVRMGKENDIADTLQKDDGIIKSQSEQYMKPQKESFV